MMEILQIILRILKKALFVLQFFHPCCQNNGSDEGNANSTENNFERGNYHD